MESHLATECPRVEISCEFGCQEKVQRKEMANHIQRNQAVHLSLLNGQVNHIQRNQAVHLSLLNGKVLGLKKWTMGVALIAIATCFYILRRK